MPSPPTSSRRALVSLAGAFSLGALAAASVHLRPIVEDLRPSAGLGRLVLDNEDDVAHAFRVRVAVGGTSRYDETHAVPPVSSRRLEESLPDARGRVTVTGTVTDAGDGPTTTTSRTFDADTCVAVGIHYSERYGIRTTSGAPIDACETA